MVGAIEAVDAGCSSSAWTLKVIDETGGIQVVAAEAEYYDAQAQSSLEVEVKAKLGLWRAISKIEKDGHLPKSNLFCNSQNNFKDQHVSKKRRLRPVLLMEFRSSSCAAGLLS